MSETKTLATRIGNVTGFIIHNIPESAQTTGEEILAGVNKGITEPVEYPEAIDDAAEILKACTKNEAIKDIIDAAADLAVHEDGETWADDIADAISVLKNAGKANRDKRRADRKGE